MPKTNVVFFAEEDGSVPVLEWIGGLSEKVQEKLVARIELLEEKGYELRRPHADILRDGIHELRTRHIKVQYRVLYFFCGKGAVLSHGLMKEGVVPPKEIELAIRRKGRFHADPERHTYRET